MTDKLKIGLLDLLAIILPGAFFLIVIEIDIKGLISEKGKANLALAGDWIYGAIFIGLAYVLGHFFFAAASLLDEWVYDKVKRLYWHDDIKLTAYVLKLKEKKTGISDGNVINAFKWCCTWLISKQPAIYGEVERYMAESKFFRSLVIVSLIILGYFLWSNYGWIKISIIILLAFFSLIRYLTRRQKSIEVAYHGVITASDEVFPAEPDPVILANLNKRLLYPNGKLYSRIKEKDRKGIGGFRSDKLWYQILKFFYAVALCGIPFFESKGSAKGERDQKSK